MMVQTICLSMMSSIPSSIFLLSSGRGGVRGRGMADIKHGGDVEGATVQVGGNREGKGSKVYMCVPNRVSTQGSLYRYRNPDRSANSTV